VLNRAAKLCFSVQSFVFQIVTTASSHGIYGATAQTELEVDHSMF